MKKIQMHALLTAFVFLFVLTAKDARSQSSSEAELRSIDNMERQAILKSDTTQLRKLMSPKLLVHNPENNVVTIDEVMSRVISGKIDYESFERTIEAVSLIDNVGIVMGKEVIKPKGRMANAGKTVTRRFTNVWIRQDGVWKLTARQATIISIQ